MQRKPVLVASPDPLVRTELTEALLAAGYGVLAAAGGMEAVEKAALDLPSLVLIQIDVEGFDGWRAVKMMGDSPRTEDTPVILLARSPTEGERRRASLIGSRGIVSPSPAGEVVAYVEVVIGSPEAGSPRVAPTRVARRRYRGRRTA